MNTSDSWSQWSEKQETFRAWRKKRHSWRDLKFWSFLRKRILDLIPFVGFDGVCVDVGCGSGFYIQHFSERFSCLSVGVDPLAVPGSFPLVVGVAESLPFQDSTVDLCSVYAVLDHVKNPVDLSSEAYRILKPGGCFMVVQGISRGKDPRFDDPTHLQNFTVESLMKLFRRFEISHVEKVSAYSWLFPGWICDLLPFDRSVLIVKGRKPGVF